MVLGIEAEERAGWEVLRVHGEIDLRTAPQLRDRIGAVLDAGAERVVLDLREVEFLDSTALSVMVGAHKRLLRKGEVLHLVVTGEAVLRVLTITGLARVFTVHDSLDDVVGAAS